MLPVKNFHEILLRSTGYIWHADVVIYLDKDYKISIFEIEFGFFNVQTKKIEVL